MNISRITGSLLYRLIYIILIACHDHAHHVGCVPLFTGACLVFNACTCSMLHFCIASTCNLLRGILPVGLSSEQQLVQD